MEMAVALYCLINFPLITAKSDDKKAEVMPNKIPLMYLNSLRVINNKPITTKTPNTISYIFIFLLKSTGSIKEAKKAPDENVASVMEILDWLMASKKVIQCKAIITPARANFKITFLGSRIAVLVMATNKNINSTAINILNQTNGMDPIDIKSPKMAVKPAINTKT